MRIFWIKTFFLIFFFLIICRLFYWQVVKADFLQAQAEKQHFITKKVAALRGNILFSDEFILASTNPTFTMFGQPKLIPKEKLIDTGFILASFFTTNEEDKEKLAKDYIKDLSSNFFWVPLEKEVTFEKKQEIEKLNLAGIGFDGGNSRFYPEGSSSAHLLGFVGSDARGDDKGYFGLEGFYDRELKGVSGLIRHEKDALGLPILIGNFLTQRSQKIKEK